MSVWTVALGVLLGWVAALLAVAFVFVVALAVSGWRRQSCLVCGWRGSRVDLLVHQIEHREGSGDRG